MKIQAKFKFSILAVLLFSLGFTACRNNGGKSDSPYSKVTLRFENSVGNFKIKFGEMIYLNASGNTYSVTLLKYYVSNFRLVRGDDSVFSFRKYLLVDAADSSSWSITLDSIPNGVFKSLNFDIGVDSAHNHTLAQGGVLDSSKGMFLDEKSGYIFFKNEGNFKDAAGVSRPLNLQLGTDRALTNVEIPLHGIQLDGGSATMRIIFNLNEAYRNPTKMDFNKDGFHLFTDSSDISWITNMSENLSKAFSLDRID
ncbi:MAG: MbnP family protein [Chitinophagaceae bacterium]